MKRFTNPTFVWLAFFAIWGIFLLGVFSKFTGTPGVIQKVELLSLLNSKKDELEKLKDSIAKMDQTIQEFQSNSHAQEIEVRKVIGFVEKNELVFDFTGYSGSKK